MMKLNQILLIIIDTLDIVLGLAIIIKPKILTSIDNTLIEGETVLSAIPR